MRSVAKCCLCLFLLAGVLAPAAEAGLFRHRHKSVSVVKVVTKTRACGGGRCCGGGVCR